MKVFNVLANKIIFQHRLKIHLEEVVIVSNDDVLRVRVEGQPVLGRFREPVDPKDQVVLDHVEGSVSHHVWNKQVTENHRQLVTLDDSALLGYVFIIFQISRIEKNSTLNNFCNLGK
jgi:hypothetical protein